MKVYFNMIVITIVVVTAISCSNDPNSIPPPVSTNYQPHMFVPTDLGFLVMDASNPDSVKGYIFEYDFIHERFEYTSTENAFNPSGFNRQFDKSFYANWPKAVKDPVLIEPAEWNCQLDYYTGIHDRNATDPYSYLYDAPVFRKFKFPYFMCSVDTANVPGFGGIFGSGLYAGKLDGFSIFYEDAIILDSSVASPIRVSTYFFDLNAGTFYSYQRNTDGTRLKETEFITSGYIGTLMTKPYGNMNSNPIDFTLADAVFFIPSWISPNNESNELYFLDYDAMKYVKVERYVKPAGDINLVNSDSARFNLVTSTWLPMSDLITGWKF